MHPRVFCKRLLAGRQAHSRAGTALVAVLDREVPAHRLNEHIRGVETEARTLSGWLRRRKWLEQAAFVGDVRQERFLIFQELLSRYETDGVELDLSIDNEFGPFCKFGKVDRLAPILTEWISELREVAKVYDTAAPGGATQGHAGGRGAR